MNLRHGVVHADSRQGWSDSGLGYRRCKSSCAVRILCSVSERLTESQHMEEFPNMCPPSLNSGSEDRTLPVGGMAKRQLLKSVNAFRMILTCLATLQDPRVACTGKPQQLASIQLL